MAEAERAGGDVLEPAPELDDPVQEIGGRLSALRVERGLRVSELARRVGVSASLISQLERGQSRPSVATLFALAQVLAVPVDAFFARGKTGTPAGEKLADARSTLRVAETRATASGEQRYVVRKGDRATIDIEGGVQWERLTPATLEQLDFLELVYGPYAESHTTLYRHPGTELVLVLSGRLHIFVGFDLYDLQPGDSIHFPSSRPHRYVNPTGEITRAVTVILHDGDGPPDSTPRRL